jgi:hypothetical protein
MTCGDDGLDGTVTLVLIVPTLSLTLTGVASPPVSAAGGHREGGAGHRGRIPHRGHPRRHPSARHTASIWPFTEEG